ncbi:hypothetical protein IVB33_39515 [Bradyrhizobium sp. 24]|uniref:hypothetical protein n=1 Tax=unclassified Bradyrhizobium TaxID=2631580 RepID=UPI001FFB8C63|nr:MULTISPECIES: hypothetical protein [unclassified Bradyrhizobium]MCK1382444.1 hypothetical protein [Bradyrhizobium sp. 24]MCK1770501.1 hypothetical protein [Bradyrhizobium sp. 134]
MAFVVTAAYLPIAFHLDATYKPSGDADVLHRPFTKIGPNAYLSYHKIAGAKGDIPNDLRRATLALTENGLALGPPHIPEAEVSALGGGRYIFLQTGNDPPVLVFSASDNSDPNTNGSVYRVTDPGARDPYEAQRRR